MALNVKLLRKIKKHILAEPRRLWMDDWVRQGRAGTFIIGGNCGNKKCLLCKQKFPSCGTAACIAGWACLLSGVKRPPSFMDMAADLLELPDSGIEVFTVGMWKPRRYAERYRVAKTPRGRAAAAAAYIDHLIANA